MKIKKFVLTELNHLGATHFSTLRDPCLGRDPYFGNRVAINHYHLTPVRTLTTKLQESGLTPGKTLGHWQLIMLP